MPAAMRQEATIDERERRYSEQEFALILRQAFELQEHPSATGSAEGLSLREIQAIAREVGLDPALVERAAAAFPRRSQGRLASVFGGPASYHLEYSAVGEVSKDDFARLVDAIRQAIHHQGEATEVLGSLEWKTVAEVSQIHVTVSAREGQTSVRVIANRGGTGFLIYFLSSIGWLIGFGVAGAVLEPSSAPGVIGLFAAAAGGAVTTARTIWKRTTAGFQSKLSTLMAALCRAVDQSLQGSEPPTEGSDNR